PFTPLISLSFALKINMLLKKYSIVGIALGGRQGYLCPQIFDMLNTLRNVIASPRYLMAAALSVLLFAGCKKNNDSEPESSVPVALKGAYRSYEVAEIRYKNDFDNTQPLAATVSGKDVNIAVIDDSTLGIVVMP